MTKICFNCSILSFFLIKEKNLQQFFVHIFIHRTNIQLYMQTWRRKSSLIQRYGELKLHGCVSGAAFAFQGCWRLLCWAEVHFHWSGVLQTCTFCFTWYPSHLLNLMHALRTHLHPDTSKPKYKGGGVWGWFSSVALPITPISLHCNSCRPVQATCTFLCVSGTNIWFYRKPNQL